jgi:hypothetical protein
VTVELRARLPRVLDDKVVWVTDAGAVRLALAALDREPPATRPP